MNSKILEIINQIREDKGFDKLSELNDNDKLRDDLGLDSFDLAELTVNIEVEFDVDVFEDGIIASILELKDKLNKK
jgi:acyl carrier protein